MFQYRTSRYVLIRIMKEKNIVLTDKNNEKKQQIWKMHFRVVIKIAATCGKQQWQESWLTFIKPYSVHTIT